MKTPFYLVLISAVFFISATATAQKYKTPADTIKLNKEYLQLTADIASLSEKLQQAQNDLPGIQGKAGAAGERAQNAADQSSNRADKVSEGDVKDAKRAKRSAKSAYKKAKSSRSADANVRSHEKKISALTSNLEKKQRRLEQVNSMRTAIYAAYPQPLQ